MKKVYISHKKGERPEIKLTVKRVESSAWSIFSSHHYLSTKINKSCKCLLFEWEGVPVAFAAILNTPRKGVPYGCSLSRLVVLPDFQGLGLSTRIFNFCGGIVKSLSDEERDYRMYIKVGYKKFGEALDRNPNVRSTQFDGKGRRRQDFDTNKYANRMERVSYCKEYIGESISGYEDLLKPIKELREYKKISL